MSQHESEDLLKVSSYIEDAKKNASEADELSFDPQGRVLVELDDCIVSLDVNSDSKLIEKYNQKIEQCLIDKVSNDTSKNIVSSLNNLTSKNSIIFLQHEMQFQLSLALEVYKKQFKEIPEDYVVSNATMQKVNNLVMQAFTEALVKATDNGTQPLDLEVLNTVLDESRDAIAEKAHDYLVDSIAGLINPSEFNLEKARLDAEHTTATSKTILHVDTNLGTLTEIEGSKVASHYRKKGDVFAHRGVKTYRINEKAEVQGRLGGIAVRTPSLPVKKGLSEKEYIEDTKVKISKLVTHYNFTKPFTYNLLTAMQHRADDLATKNKQTQSARHIMLGAHAHNREVIKREADSLCLVQAISVNGFGKPLGYSYFGLSTTLPNEATLLAEMALLHNIGQEGILEKYKQFLSPPEPKTFLEKFFNLFKSAYFVNSPEGNRLRKEISDKKNLWQGAIEVEASDKTSLVSTSIKKIMAYDLHFSHDYAKLLQTLSLFLEDESIIGCKSGNERTPIIMEREQLLKKAILPDDLQKAFLSVASSNDRNSTIQALNTLKIAVNRHYNAENTYGASAIMPLVDQAAGHKISAKNGYTFDSNKAEDQRSEGITNLKQKSTRKLQAHNGLPDYMHAAVVRRIEANKTSDISSNREDSSDSSKDTYQMLVDRLHIEEVPDASKQSDDELEVVTQNTSSSREHYAKLPKGVPEEDEATNDRRFSR